MTTIHVIAPFHTVPNLEHSHCAFTMKALRFAKMMKPFGYRVVEYANEGSTSEADEHVVMLEAKEYAEGYKPETTSPGNQAQAGTPVFHHFEARLERELARRVQMGDIIAHIFGPRLHPNLVQRFPGAVHVETGIGYPWTGFGAVPIFESHAWRHYQWGRVGNPGGVLPGNALMTARSYVVPNYFDVDDWPLSTEPANRVAFMSRFVPDKGTAMLTRIIKAWDETHPGDGLRFALAGMGDFNTWFMESKFNRAEGSRVEYVGPITGAERARFLGRAIAFLLPTIFVEPFGGAAVEAMLCGTPALTSDWGAFTETVQDGVTGWRCRTVDQYVKAIEKAATWGLRRADCGAEARRRYSLEACGAQFHAIFQELLTRASID